MPLNYQNNEIRDFSGGMSDRIVDVPSNVNEVVDNFNITELGTLEVREGFDVFFESDDLNRIMGLWDFEGGIYAFRNQLLYRHAQTDKGDWAASTNTPALANGVGVLGSFYTATDAGSVDFGGGPIAFVSGDKVQYNGTIWSKVVAVPGFLTSVTLPNAEPFFQFTGNTSFPNAIEWRSQLLMLNTGQASPLDYNRPMRVYTDENGIQKAHEMGLPEFPSTPTFVGTGAGNSYVYGFHYSYTFKVGSVTYKTVGPTYTVNIEAPVPIDAANAITINNLPVLSVVNNQIDGVNVKLEVYRSVVGGSPATRYRLPNGVLSNGTTSVIDNNPEANVVTGLTIYTDSGQTQNQQAPKSRYLTVVNDVAYYGNVFEDLAAGAEVRPYRVHQAIPGIPSAVDATAFVDVDDEVTGLGNFNGVPVIFTNTYIYRLEGQISALGNGILRTRVIDNAIGCVSHNSIVTTTKGIFWAGRNGFYQTDGFNIKLASVFLDDQYRKLVDDPVKSQRITATYDHINERIFWSAGEGTTENDQIWVLNLRSTGFSRWNGQFIFSSAALYRENELLRGDNEGYIYSHRDELSNDIVRDNSISSNLWLTTHIPFRWKHSAYNFDNSGVKKWVSQVTFTTKSEDNFLYKPISENDASLKTKDMKEVRRTGTFQWGDPDFVWGDEEIAWRIDSAHVAQRHFPRKSMRCRRKQVGIEPAKGIRYDHETHTVADVSEENPGVTPNWLAILPAPFKWPLDIVGDTISFSSDNYATEHNIKTRSDDTLVISGGAGLIGTSLNWRIKGFFRKQRFELKSIVHKFAILQDIGDKHQKSEDGE